MTDGKETLMDEPLEMGFGPSEVDIQESVERVLRRERDEALAEVKRLREGASAMEARANCSCGGWRRGQHRMFCREYVGPLEHKWTRTSWNGTFGGLDHWCSCGGWFRQGGLAGHGDGTETAEAVCPQADLAHRGE